MGLAVGGEFPLLPPVTHLENPTKTGLPSAIDSIARQLPVGRVLMNPEKRGKFSAIVRPGDAKIRLIHLCRPDPGTL